MLLCVAGGSGAEFTRDRPRAGSRCSSQSFLIKTNANQQVMVEERCSMTSSAVSTDHVAARATLSLHLRTNKEPARSHTCSKEPSVAYRSRVIVVSGEDAAFSSEKGETCSTTTTFKSNVVNGKRGTNTILVRYKPSKPVSEDSDDELRFEFYPKNEGVSSPTLSSSPPSTISSESSSSKKDQASTSAWAQIMELEGYRSPAIGLDNCPSKHAPAVGESDSSLSGESYRSELSAADPSLCNSYISRQSETSYSNEHPFHNTGEEGRFRKHNIVSIASKCDSGPFRMADATQISTDVIHGSNNPDFVVNQADCNQKQALSVKPKGPVQNRYSDTASKNNSYHDVSRTDPNNAKISPKYKSSMLRSESSRTPKIPPLERNKNRRKTLPDGNLSLNPSSSSVTKRDSVAKNQKSPEHDPNASWGRYNSRAMRDSVRKVAEKYAETVYMKRQTRSLLDSLPEAKGVQLTRYVAPSNELDHAHLSKRVLQLHAKRAGSTSHLHEIPNETEALHRSRLHVIMPASTRHDHSDGQATNDCKSESCKLNQKLEKEKSLVLGDNFRINNTLEEDSPNDDPKMVQVNDPYFEKDQSSCMGKDESRRNFVLDSHNSEEGRSRNIFSNTKMYQTPHSSKHFQKNISSIECKISSDESKHPFHLSVNMKDIKSKLCADCAQSTEFGPPLKQSACRGKHHLNDTFARNAVKISQISVLKRTPLVIDEDDPCPSLNLRPFRSTDVDSKFENGTRKCTMLTAREMAELVHGKGNADSKVSQAGVTSKVSSWIQKQKDKRKPVFFIGDTPSFFIEKSSENNPEVNSKTSSRKSRRSLSLSNVREGEVSKSCNGTSNTSEFKSASNTEEELPKSNEHKGLFIKRTSSSCSNRGSLRRKSRQGSPVREESEYVKDANCNRNRVDGCLTPWNNRFKSRSRNDCCEPILPSYESNPKTNAGILISKTRENCFGSEIAIQSPEERFENGIESFQSVKSQPLSDKCLSTSKVLSQTAGNKEFTYEDSLNSSLLGSQGSRHSYSIIATRDVDDLVRPERSAVSKKLLNFKQITRALSLHSLKKKTKDVPICSNTATHLETAPAVSLSKWTRGSKRKIENLKYGSLRKSVSYCELTARGAKISGKLEFPVNLLNETKKTAKRPAIPSRPSSTCACSSNLRRSVSLFWQFPLHKLLEYTADDPKSDIVAKIWFSRLHYPNTFLPFLRDVKNKRHPTPDVAESVNHQHLDSESRVSLVDYKHPCANHPSCSKHERKTVSVVHELDIPKSALNGDKEVQDKSGIIMGLGRNHILNEIDNSSHLSVLEEYLPLDNSSGSKLNKVPVSMSKSKTPIVLRLQNKTSRSERYAKGRSASEIWSKSVQKDLAGGSANKKRPSSQFYDIDEFQIKTENEANLGQLSSIVSCSQPTLCAIDQVSNLPQSSSGLVCRHLPLHTSTPQLTPADSLLQRFRKSFAIRFKKKSEPASNAGTPITSKTLTVTEESSKEKPTPDVPNHLDSTPCDKKPSPRNHRKELSLTYSNGRKRNRRKTDWRTSLFYDSVDSIFDTSFKSGVDKCRTPQFAGSDANIIRKRAASTSDYSPKSKAFQRPLSIVDCLTTENVDDTKVPDGKQDFSRTAPDTTNSEDQQKNLTSLDQIWRANPVKLCRVHSRLLMCRHKGRYRLRRSISQPVELEMTGSIHNLRESTHGSADHDSFQKGSLSSEDEASSESDIYHSYCCSPTRRSNTCWELSGDGNMYAEALWDHETLDSEELPFQAGDIIEVTDTSDQDWWWGTKDGQGGWFPSAFVRLYVSHRGPSLHFNGQQSDGIQIPYSPCKVSMNNLSCEQVRANIVQEIVATERDYVKHLKDVVEGYLKQVHRRPDMFSKERIETVFGNIKDIYTFQSQFLKELEDCLDKDSPHLSQIGNCFLDHKEEFKIYSQYCNNHPLAVSELQELYCDSQYIHFFEACRLLQEMIDISLDGFLLTPIQRICKYPLQLAELLKFTDSNHPDHVPVSNALAAMKEVAELVNERKRRMECLERIAEWQSTIEGWEGPDVLDTSSVLIHCGEVTRVSSSWSRDIYLFIFDHQLIYCKKDLLKRHTYAYKGRLNLDHCDIIDVEDGKDSQFAVNVKNAWKIYCRDKEKWYLFYAKTFPEKEQWLRAFKAERQRVNDDEKQAFVVTEEAKRSARLAVHNKQKPKRPRVKFTKGRRCHPDVAVTELLLDSPNAKSRSGSLPSNIHPELAIMAGAKLGPTRKKGSGWFHFGSGKKPKS